MTNSIKAEKLPLITKLMYGVGDAGINMADTMVGLLFAIFLTDVVGLRPALAALAVFIGRSSDYINDPIIGYISDRTRTRWGRRRPFLLWGALPFVLAYILLWWHPPFESQVWLAIYYGVAFILYDTTATILYMPYFALTPELTSDYDERTTLTTYRMAFSILGGMIAFVVPLAIIGSMTPANAGRVLAVGAGLAFISILPMLVVFFGTSERTEFQQQEQPKLKDSILAAFKNRPFLFALGIFMLTYAALDIVQSTLLYFLKHQMHLEAQGDLIFGLLFVAALLSLPFWNWAARHWDKQKAYIGGMVFLGLMVIGLGIIRPEWGLPATLVLSASAGIGVGAIQVLTWAMIPDTVEWDELHTGQRHEGMYYSLVTLGRKIAASLALPLVLLVLDWTGYAAAAETQPASAILGIRLLIGPIPAVFLGAGIIFALFYPLGRNRHAELRAEISMRQAAGEQK
jgi:glycoside/pentoside/hexuronide:cation symporter, GPH family